MTDKNIQLTSTISEDNKLTLALRNGDIPKPSSDEVIIRIEAAPLNPSDFGVLFSAADMSTAVQSGDDNNPIITADVPAKLMPSLKNRLGKQIPVGNEAAGTVIDAGTSPEAQALIGKTVSVIGGGTYRQFLCANINSCLVHKEGTTAKEAASSFVNPMTALAMVETMHAEGHKAIIHAAAASNLGQMLNRLCIADGIDLINIVRKEEQETLLRNLGAKYVVNSTSETFIADLTAMIIETGATLAFDPIGGGQLTSDILNCMEVAASRDIKEHSIYGSDTFKQVYIYGALDRGPIILNRTFGFAWGVNGFLLFNALAKLGTSTAMKMRARIADEITTTFASSYTHEISLAQALELNTISAYAKHATGEKYLITPQS